MDTNPVPTPTTRISPAALRKRKGGIPIVCLTAYSAPMARLIDSAVDLILVGDSLGMVVYGFETTVPVTLDMMIRHGAAVARGARHACVILDLPFGTYQETPVQAYRNAAHALAETGVAGVKVEGGEIIAETKTEDDELLIHDCDLDATRFGKETMFDFARHRRTEHYGLIVSQTGVVPPKG